MYLQNYWLRKRSLDKCLKGRVSDDPSTDNMANGLKNCCNTNNCIFTMFFNHCEGNFVEKSLF